MAMDETAEIQEFYFTFGVQYGYLENSEQHPLGLHHDEYAVVEAPDEVVARMILIAAMRGENKWSMTYTREEFDYKDRIKHFPKGEGLRIAWFRREDLELFQDTLSEAVFGGTVRQAISGLQAEAAVPEPLQ